MVNKYSAKLSGLKRTKWDNKSPKQQAQYFMKVYQELGLSIPKYLLDGKMTTKQLESNINKLTRSTLAEIYLKMIITSNIIIAIRIN